MSKILIVDDDQVYRDSLVQEFNDPDNTIITAQDGEEAVSKAKNEQPDLILLDIMLPKKLGLNVIEELKLDDLTKYIPIVALSNFGGDQNKERALSIGAADFVVKAQLNVQEIAEIVRKYLPKN